MDRHDRRDTFPLHDAFHDIHHLKLVSDIEITCRLIQEENVRFLRKCPCDQDLLLLTSADLVKVPHRKLHDPKQFQHLQHLIYVLFAALPAKMRASAHENSIKDGGRKNTRGGLGHITHLFCNLHSRHLADVIPIQEYYSTSWGQDPVDTPDQRGFAGAVRTDDAEYL